MELSAGMRFGFLTLTRPYVAKNNQSKSWWATCDCGVERRVQPCQLISGDLKSCGCQRNRVTQTEKVRAHQKRLEHSRRRHGHSSRTVVSPEYVAWGGMIQRCTNPNSKAFAYYGVRGISVCERWLKFENFFADMGPRPPKHEIERENNEGNYEPGNCRWATRHDQMRNTRYVRMVEVDGETMCVRDAVKKLGLKESRVYGRVFRQRCSHQESLDFYREVEGKTSLANRL